MAQTMAEKLLSRHNLAGKPVQAGDILEGRIDGAMVHYHAEVAGTRVQQAMIGSCANGRYEDIEIAARILNGRKVAKGVRFIISPASQQVYLNCVKAGLVETLLEAGAQIVTPGCGVCQPKVGFLSDGEVCITATPRNFKGRNNELIEVECN